MRHIIFLCLETSFFFLPEISESVPKSSRVIIRLKSQENILE
jgi:hypothetical protein